MAKTKFSFEKSLEEIQVILKELNQGKTGIDQLHEQVRRAKELLKQCQDKLRKTEAELADDEID